MKRLRALPLGLFAALGLGVSLPNGDAVLEREPPELVARLRAQGLVVLEDVAQSDPESFVIAWVLFAQPPDRTVALVTSPERQLEWRPDLDDVRTVAQQGEGRTDEVEMRVMFRKLLYRVQYLRDPATSRIQWALDPSFDNDLARFDGFWEFYALADGATLGRFGTRVDAGALFPASVQRSLTRRSVVGTMEACKKWVDSGGTWRP